MKDFESTSHKGLTVMETHAFLQKLLGRNKVDWMTVGEVFTLREGKYSSARSKADSDTRRVPLFGLIDMIGDENILSEADDYILVGQKEEVFPANSIVIAPTHGVHALITVEHVCDYHLTSCSIKSEFKDVLDIGFAYHYFYVICEQVKLNENVPGWHRLVRNKTKNLLLPIPCINNPKESIKIQSEIARILGAFTELETELGTQLALQRKQHEYYRYQLLSFPK